MNENKLIAKIMFGIEDFSTLLIINILPKISYTKIFILNVNNSKWKYNEI